MHGYTKQLMFVPCLHNTTMRLAIVNEEHAVIPEGRNFCNKRTQCSREQCLTDERLKQTKQVQLGASFHPTPITTTQLHPKMTIFFSFLLRLPPKQSKEHTNQGFWAARIQNEQEIFGSQHCPKTAPQFP